MSQTTETTVSLSEPSVNHALDLPAIYTALLDRLEVVNRRMIVWIGWYPSIPYNLRKISDCRSFSDFNTLTGCRSLFMHSVFVTQVSISLAAFNFITCGWKTSYTCIFPIRTELGRQITCLFFSLWKMTL